MANYLPLFAPAFREDVIAIARWSEASFGAAAADRYFALIQQALHDLLENPHRNGARAQDGLPENVLLYRLAYSRDNVIGEKFKRPRHIVVYRLSQTDMEFLRLLHDSQDLARHLPGSSLDLFAL